MKKMIKGSFVTIGILMLLGFILSGIGFLFGGVNTISWINGNSNINHYLINKLPIRFFDYDWNFNQEDYDFTIQGNNQEVTFSESEDIVNLEINLGIVELVIEDSKDDNFYLKSNTIDKYGYYQEEGTLCIEGLKDESQLLNNRYIKNEVTLQIPEDKTLENILIEIGAGEVEIESIQGKDISFSSGASMGEISEIKAQEIDLEVGAGELIIQKLETDHLDFISGIGEISILEGNIKEGNLELGIGECYYEGKVEKSLSVIGGMGMIELVLEGKEEDFNFDISGGIGNFKMNDYSYTGIGGEKIAKGTLDKVVTIESGIGDISIDFK